MYLEEANAKIRGVSHWTVSDNDFVFYTKTSNLLRLYSSLFLVSKSKMKCPDLGVENLNADS